jgi:hypothetical protein
MGRHDDPDRESSLPAVVLGVGGLLAAVVIVGVAFPGWSRSTVLDQQAVQQGVTTVLSNGGYDVGQVSCPPDQPVEVGHRFSCRATVDGQQREVTITVLTGAGEYEISVPR